MRKNNKREAILSAALEIVEDKGARHLTMDAVAARSGVSKGGVLYHFESKDALLSGMLQHLIDSNRHYIDQCQAQSDAGLLVAVLNARDRMTVAESRASLAILAASAENQALLTPVREMYQTLFQQALADSDHDPRAALLLLASEGIRYLDVLNVNPFKREQILAVMKTMDEQARQLSAEA